MLENDIKNLIKILEESRVDELEISTFWGKQKIKIRKKGSHLPENENKSPQSNLSPPIIDISDNNSQIPNTIENDEIVSQSEEPIISTASEHTSETIKAPLVGTYYQSSKPDTPPFISEGDIIKPGQVICIIEAMKIFNEIESEISGKVVDILIKDGTPVEYDQDLIVISPE